MRFMMLIKSDAKAESGALPDEQLLTEMGNFNEELVKAGVLRAAEGLQPSSKGVRVRLTGKAFTVTDGPFGDPKQLIAGFWLLETKTKQEAIDWGKRVPGKEGEIELRALFEMSDFPVDPTETADGWRENEQRFRDEADAAAAGGAPPVPRKSGTTRYIVMLRSDNRTESDAMPDTKTLEQMGALMDKAVRSGALLSGEGLKPSAKGARIKLSGDKRTVVDGPFTETKEMIAGYCVIQVKSKEEAIAFAKSWLPIHLQGSGADTSEIEIRQIFELEDFPAAASEKADGWRQQEQRMRERLGQ